MQKQSPIPMVHPILSNPAADFRAVTVADYTFIVNTTKLYNGCSYITYPFTGLIAVKQGDYNKRYSVYLDGTQVVNYVTSATDEVEVRTDNIATEIATTINGLSNFPQSVQQS